MPTKTYTRKQYIAAVIVAAMIGAFMSWSVGVYCGRKEVQLDAARLGLGVYHVNRTTGQPAFKWNLSLLPAE